MPGTPSGLRTDTDVVASPSAEPEPSSATRRKNALARALFGASDSEQSLTPPSPQLTDGPIVGSGGFSSERSPLIESSASLRSLRETISPMTYAVNASVVNASATELPDKQLQLAREVQRRAEEAMAQLKKTPSNPKINDGSHRKRIDLSQISGPKLVSASTSVDAIPVRSSSVASGQIFASQAQSANSAKLGTRFKKFRGSLRARPATSPSSEESTQHPFEPASTDRSLAGTPDGPYSAIELSRAKVSIPSPPATTGPGLKGFVSRFLKPRSGETPEHDRRKRVPSSASTLEPPPYFGPEKIEQRHERTEPRQGIQSAPPDNKSFRPNTPVSPEEPPSPPNPPPSAQSPPDESAARDVDENALKQFIDAANNLGLDQDALSEFLGRSTSVGSRLTVQGSRHRSIVSNDKPGNDNGNLALSETAPLFGTSSPGSRYSVGQPSLRPPGDIIGKAPIRRPSTRNTTTSDAAVVRRTLIFPAEARQSVLEPGMGLRKSSSTRRRRSASAASTHSNRSLHDRVPTPPPPKSSAARRFSAEQSPPLPLIPNSLMAHTQAISTPQPTSAVPLEKSNSAYDSLQVFPQLSQFRLGCSKPIFCSPDRYDMYTGDGKPGISANADMQLPDSSGSNSGPTLQNLEPGTAVEVLELANGETIWCVPVLELRQLRD
jgi:serine/arginine repetitive matrix protein 2